MTTHRSHKKWLLIFVIICGDVVRHPLSHNTTSTYRAASTLWWETHDVYNYRAHDGFFYFPQAALIFSPFNVLPFFAGEIIWRVVGFGLFAYALVRLQQVFLHGKRYSFGKTFLILSLLAIPSAFASLRNAQFDLPLAALVVLAAAEVASARWTAAAVYLCLGVALKPLAVVPLLLFGALYWKLIPRVIVGLIIVALLPFLTETPAFVAHEYVRCFQTLEIASVGNEARYSDLAALLSRFGYDAPEILKTIARVFFALAYLGLGALAIRRLPRVNAAWTVGALAADYLMLFNPRTETCSYVFLGPFVASLALFYAQEPGRKWLGYALGFAALGLACDAFPKLGTFSIHDMTDRWFKPFIALLFLPVLIQFILENRRHRPSHHSHTPERNLSSLTDV
jgi:alpha-1,2-mannosyltransferase